MTDLTKLSDDDLQALKAGDLSKVSDAGLMVLKGSAAPKEQAGSSPLDGLKKIGMAAVKGAVAGPHGAIIGAATEGMSQGADALSRLGYEVGGRATDLTAKVASPETAAAVGTAANLVTQTAPMYGAGKLAETALSPAFNAGAKGFMQSAIKPGSADLAKNVQNVNNADRAIQTLLDEGINVTPTGMAELRSRIGALHGQVRDLIANSGKGVDAIEASKVDRALNSFRYAIGNREANLASIKDAQQSLFRALDELHPFNGSTAIPIQLAQKIKQATQRQLSDFYGELGGAQTEGLKDVAHGLRMGIEKAEPATAVLNAKMEQMLNALSVTEKHALMALNKNPAGLSLLAENPSAAAAFMFDRSTAFKSLAARMIYAGRNNVPFAAGVAGERLYESSRPKQ